MSEIETARLWLKKYEEKDKAGYNGLLIDEIVMKHVDTGAYSPDRAEASWSKLTKELYPQGVKTIYGVFLKDGGRYLGHASIRPRPAKKEEWEIGYILKREEWGKGFATEIARALVKFSFETLKLQEVFATIDDDHLDSIRVAEKAGLEFVRHEYDQQGRFSVYSIKRERFNL